MNGIDRVLGRHFATGEPIELTVENGRIASVDAIPASADLPYIAPAFFDLQINGCLGHDFSSETLSLEKIRCIVRTCREHGIGASARRSSPTALPHCITA